MTRRRLAALAGRRGAAYAAVVLACALVVAIVVVTPWTPLPAPPGGRTAVDPARDFTTAQINRVGEFSGLTAPWSRTSVFVGIGVAGLLGLTPVGARIVRFMARPFGGGWPWQVASGAALFSAIGLVVALPFAVPDQGAPTRTWAGWLVAAGKSFGVNALVTGLALLSFYGLVRLAPTTWWLWSALGAAGLVVGLSFAYPVLIEPIFTRFTPMPAGPLRDSLLDLAARDHVPVSDVLIAHTSAGTQSVNAYVSGFGETRHLVLFDTLPKRASADQVRLIVAHELGHVRNGDVLRGTLVGALAVALACCLGYLLLTGRLTRWAGVAGIRDAGSVALVLFVVAGAVLVATPVRSLMSRRIEARADVHSLDLTRDPITFRYAQRSMSLSNMSNLRPNPVAYALFADHPTAPERIALARDWAKLHGMPVP